ncbi:uncharacterized protein TRAVEDRAFT_170487 [Trametes versicolor FP-101664 SS1]|uniref:uncharacterized protein n=1 Tax=Trametes versicolor (strain FP-101664) TaxID=717944 RepID=UPI00046229E1|nr:uncharacterized protein TRAVEDRAFT_170487 [Trametes versicolor FP-101664 SS1]EIW56561.1 hypothetical protein TRAVEDRAFT_170487 [Trametes versicolor FP-101664 SS1]
MRSFILAAFFALCASQVLALGVNITGFPPGLSATQFLGTSDPSLAACSSGQPKLDACTFALGNITACGTDDGCLCSNATVLSIVACEECMFTQLVNDNRRPVDLLAGQTSAIAAYSAACTAVNHTIPLTAKEIALAVPTNWDGPFGQGLTTLGTVVTVAAGAFIGVGMITVVNTM